MERVSYLHSIDDGPKTGLLFDSRAQTNVVHVSIASPSKIKPTFQSWRTLITSGTDKFDPLDSYQKPVTNQDSRIF